MMCYVYQHLRSLEICDIRACYVYISVEVLLALELGQWVYIKIRVHTDIAVRIRNYYTATGNHKPYGITQCNLPPGSSSDFSAFTPAEAGTRFSHPGGMQRWVDLGGGYIPR